MTHQKTLKMLLARHQNVWCRESYLLACRNGKIHFGKFCEPPAQPNVLYYEDNKIYSPPKEKMNFARIRASKSSASLLGTAFLYAQRRKQPWLGISDVSGRRLLDKPIACFAGTLRLIKQVNTYHNLF